MNSIFKLAPMIAVLFFSQYPSMANAVDTQPATTRQTVEALFEAFNRHDLDDVVTLYDDSIKLVTPSFPEARYGLEFVRDEYRGHFENIPGVHNAVTRIIVEGDYAAVQFTASWEQPTETDPGARGEIHIAAIIKVVNGKIVEDTAYFDRKAFESAEGD